MGEETQTEGEFEINLAQQIRLLREQRRLSQKALAEAGGISRNTLSLLERGQTSPTVSTLKQLAGALGVDITPFFRPFDAVHIVHTKGDRRPYLQLAHGILSDLGLGMFEQLVSPLTLKLEPGARSGSPISHDGQDFVFCLTGEVLYSVNGRAYVLEPGDSLLFDGHLPHRFLNSGKEEAEMMIILSTPRDPTRYIAGHFSEEIPA